MNKEVIFVIFVTAIIYSLSWAVTVGIIKLITMCFGWQFRFLTATGIWLVMILARSVFKNSNSK